jgi:hypothetical protein
MFLWLTPFVAQRRVIYGVLGVAVVWWVTSLFIEGFDCDMFPKQCPGAVSLA